MGKILITRPMAQANILSQDLNAYGLKTLIHPMLDIEFLEAPTIDFKKYDACIITSVNAATILSNNCDDKALDIYCVGYKTAQFLKNSGFVSIKNISNSVQDLIAIIQTLNHKTSMIYLRGDKVTNDLKQFLAHHNIQEYIVYKSHKAKELEKGTIKALISGEISDILFYSARTLNAFVEAVIADKQQLEIRNALTRTRALCLTNKMVKYATILSQENGIDLKFKDILSLQTNNKHLTTETLISRLKELDKELDEEK